jgi:MSHA biogenesis protein MshG
MPPFKYKARDRNGTLREGVLDARGKDTVAEQLAGQGLLPVFIAEQTSPPREGISLGWYSRVQHQDLIVFSRQLATLLSAGVPFIQCLSTAEKQTERPRLRAAIADVRRDVEGGTSFSEALSKHPDIFNRLYISMIRAGETAGILDDILNRLAMLAEHDEETRARVRTAVRYPLIVVVTICVAFVFLVTFVIPKFAAMFERFKTELPLPTRVLIGIHTVVQHFWWLILVVLGMGAWAVIAYVNTTRGRRQWDRFKLRLPVFGVLFQKVALSRFARVFSAMQRSGLSMMLTLEVAAETVGNVVIERVVTDMRDSLRDGKGLRGPMEASGLFPPLVIQMMAVGEEVGSIDVMLEKVSDYYDRDVEYTLRNLSTMIEPILLFFIGGMVLFLALGVFLPMWNMINLFKK